LKVLIILCFSYSPRTHFSRFLCISSSTSKHFYTPPTHSRQSEEIAFFGFCRRRWFSPNARKFYEKILQRRLFTQKHWKIYGKL